MSAPAATKFDPSSAAATAALSQFVEAISRGWRVATLLRAVSIAVALPLLFLWISFALDNWLHLSLAGRLLIAFAGVAIVVWAVWNLVCRVQASRLSEDAVALAIERCTPGGVENRLINSLQLARAGGHHSPDLANAVVKENCTSLERMQLAPVASWRPTAMWMLMAVIVLLIGAVYGALQPKLFTNAASRIFLPLANIQPLYRTTLDVQPGDVEAAGDVDVVIKISGQRPSEIVLYRATSAERTHETIVVPTGASTLLHQLRDVRETTRYAVRGGDFTSRYFRITVPEVTELLRVEATYIMPKYSRVTPRKVQQTAGELKSLVGSKAELVFHLNLPAEHVELAIARRTSSKPKPIKLARLNDKAFAGELVIDEEMSYTLRVQRMDQAFATLGPFTVHATADAEPQLELRGLESTSEVQIDSVLPVSITATDDFGLAQVELSYRIAADHDQAGVADAAPSWQPIAAWPASSVELTKSHNIACEQLAVAVGDRVEIALRAKDHSPSRSGAWTVGPVAEVIVGGEAAELVRRYEQILASERELAVLVEMHRTWLADETAWLRKLEQGDLRWDDSKNIIDLHTAVFSLRQQQEKLRTATGAAANAMVDSAGNLRIGLGLLADSEHVRLIRMLDAVPARDEPQAKQAALADARTTQERVIRSLEEIAQEFTAFRADWELNHMLPLATQLAEQQSALAEQSKRYAGAANKVADPSIAKAMQRRQSRIGEVCQLIQPAFVSVAALRQSREAELSAAFTAGAKTLASDELKQQLAAASSAIEAAKWTSAAQSQTTVAESLQGVCDQIRSAQAEAARKLLAALEEQAKSDAAAQSALEALLAGSGESGVKDVGEIELQDLTRVREVVAQNKTNVAGSDELDLANAPLFDVDRSKLELQADSGVRQNPYSLALGTTPEKTAALGVPPGLEQNQVKPFIQEEFDDLVGKLLDEADELHKEFEAINLSTNQNNDDPGEIQKQGGRINSTGAVAATGNKKPPTTNVGGVSRTGRQGARAHGMIADEEFINRRGRDQVQEGQETVADQEGRSRETLSDDPQLDTSTGVGGKRVESENTNFSLADVGKWKDEFASRMEKPQAKQNIVERAGEPISAETAALLRDMNGKQEQVIERLKTLRKELKNLYLPTEHLDELADELAANLDRLKDRPDAELFCLQSEHLQRLHGALRVFQGPGAGLEPSLPRERVLRGRVLDEPTSPVIPGYEEAVKQYFLNLAHE